MRPLATDFLHNFRFQAKVDVLGSEDILAHSEKDAPQAGFSNVTLPELTIEQAEYKEGMDIYPRKYPGPPTVGELSFSRGLAVKDTTFWDWARKTAEGNGEYRATVTVYHYHRREFLTQSEQATSSLTRSGAGPAKAARTYVMFNCFPVRLKVGGDLDATSNEVSIQELDVAYESFTILVSDEY